LNFSSPYLLFKGLGGKFKNGQGENLNQIAFGLSERRKKIRRD